jgi:hypothetical protein
MPPVAGVGEGSSFGLPAPFEALTAGARIDSGDER